MSVSEVILLKFLLKSLYSPEENLDEFIFFDSDLRVLLILILLIFASLLTKIIKNYLCYDEY